MKKLLIIVMICALLCGMAAAYEGPKDFTDLTLEEAMEDLMAYYQLTEQNFSMSFYNTVTGESYDFNENKFSMAASTYKLPLNMCFYEMAQEGKIDPDEPFLWTGMTLHEVHRQSVLFSNNEVSEAMTGYWNNYYIYKENMRKYSSMPVEEIDPDFYLTNVSCTRLMIDTLKYLYDNSDRFEELIGYMKDAVPGQYFKAGVQEYEIAHKYGEVDGYINDVAIIYTPQPILLAVYTQGIYGAGVCAEIARLVTDYTVWQAGQGQASAEECVEIMATEEETVPEETVPEETVAEPEAEPPVQENEPVTEEEPAAEQEPSGDISEEHDTEIPEAPEQEEPTEADSELTQEEAQRQQELDQMREKRSMTILWSVIGIVSLLMLVAIPLLMRKRY